MEAVIGCSVIIYNLEGKILICKRSKMKDKFPLTWENIGGRLEHDETPEECIRREAKEEIGCLLKDLKLFRVYVNKEENTQYVIIVFTAKLDDTEIIQPNYEIEDIKWITEDEINNYSFCTENNKKRLFDFYEEFQF